MEKYAWMKYAFTLMLGILWTRGHYPGVKATSTIHIEYFTWVRGNDAFKAEQGASLTIGIGSNLVIKCPFNQNNATQDEYYKLYWLPEVAFRECFKPNDYTAQLFLNCNKPNTPLEFTQEITTFSGVPGAKDFKVGQSYYISTLSTGTFNGLNNEDRGACKDYNMKLNITITDSILPSTQAPTDPLATTSKSVLPNITLPVTTTTTTTTSTSTTTTSTTTSTTATTTLKTMPTVITTTTLKPHSSDIPDPTDTINVPDNGNSAVIDVRDSAQTVCKPSTIVLSLCLSILHILFLYIPQNQFNIER